MAALLLRVFSRVIFPRFAALDAGYDLRKRALRNDLAARVQDESALVNCSCKLFLALRRVSVRQAQGICHAIAYCLALVVTASVHLQLSGTRSLIPDCEECPFHRSAPGRPEADIGLQ
jgi:hypothetical protein